jgi:hypothetical protein
MILFDKSKLMKFSRGSARTMVNILEYITYRPIPKSRGDIKRLKYQSIDWSGDSYLLNPESLLRSHKWYSIKETAQYILLAAKRSYPDYALFKTKTLPVQIVNTKAIESNRLLVIKNEEIHFLFE